jgi:L-threonylcarbamoyladenylate synthase
MLKRSKQEKRIAMKVVKADEEGLREAAQSIRMGGVVIYPTETVYGIGCDPANPDATRRVCEIKERATNPLPIACADISDAKRIVKFNSAAEILAKKFWPGPLMLVLPKIVDYSIWVTHGKNTLGVRVPDHEVARRLTKLCGGMIVSTSANKSGERPPWTPKEAIQQIGKEVDIVVDGGPTPGYQPSTVLDLTSEELWILRTGPISGQQIKEALSR